jgi:hypothetical protein
MSMFLSHFLFTLIPHTPRAWVLNCLGKLLVLVGCNVEETKPGLKSDQATMFF